MKFPWNKLTYVRFGFGLLGEWLTQLMAYAAKLGQLAISRHTKGSAMKGSESWVLIGGRASCCESDFLYPNQKTPGATKSGMPFFEEESHPNATTGGLGLETCRALPHLGLAQAHLVLPAV